MVPDGTADPLSIPWANKKSSGTLIPPKDHLRSATGEQPHPGNRIEWWFVHGSFNGLKCGSQVLHGKPLPVRKKPSRTCRS